MNRGFIMTDRNEWLDNVKSQINLLKDTLSERDYRKYKLRLLLCLAERIAQFRQECGQCQILQPDISALVQEVGNVIRLSNRERKKSYFKSIADITNHLQKQHKLVSEGYYAGIGIAIGSGIGVALGAVLDQFGGGIPIGIVLGLVIGTVLDAKARREGRIVCPKETTTTAFNMSFKIPAVILGLLVLAGLAAYWLFQKFS